MAEMSNPVDVMGRELPYSQEAELAVIGSALTNSHSVAESVEILRPSDFYFPQNKEIFSVILDLFNENAAIDFITVSNKLSQSDKLEAVGGIAYLRNAATNVPTTRHVTYYSQIIKEKAVLRTLIKSANDISDMAYGQNDKVERIVDQAEQLIFDVTSSNNKSDILPISEIFMGSYQELVENSLNQSGITGLPTGFDELNRRTGGFHGGELILIAGRPGMGKSSFAVNIAEHASITDKKTVAIFNIRKLSIFTFPTKFKHTGFTASVFCDNTFSQIFILGIGIIIFVTIQKHNHIGVLLDSARFTQVRKHGTLIASRNAERTDCKPYYMQPGTC